MFNCRKCLLFRRTYCQAFVCFHTYRSFGRIKFKFAVRSAWSFGLLFWIRWLRRPSGCFVGPNSVRSGRLEAFMLTSAEPFFPGADLGFSMHTFLGFVKYYKMRLQSMVNGETAPRRRVTLDVRAGCLPFADTLQEQPQRKQSARTAALPLRHPVVRQLHVKLSMRIVWSGRPSFQYRDTTK